MQAIQYISLFSYHAMVRTGHGSTGERETGAEVLGVLFLRL